MKTKFKIAFSVTLVVAALFIAIHKVHVRTLLRSEHSSAQYNQDFTSGEPETEKVYDLKKIDGPVYYTVFKFILNFLPLKENKQTS